MPTETYKRRWGRRPNRSLLERVFEKIDGDFLPWECWTWLGARQYSRGGDVYGSFGYEKHTFRAHRLVYELLIHPIPKGLVLDHTCRNTLCCNPFHLDEVTHRENLLRGDNPAALNARKTHCVHGHPFSPENTLLKEHGRRICLMCEYRRNHNRPKKEHVTIIRQRKPPATHKKKTHCIHGHEYTPQNSYLYTHKNGKKQRICRTCHHIRMRANFRNYPSYQLHKGNYPPRKKPALD